MSGNIFDKALTLSKFRGTLVGALLGDCFGGPFEGDENISKVILQKYFDKLEDPQFKAPLKKYSDDTVMTKGIAESLVEEGCFNEVDIAKRFVLNFFSEPGRGYGESVVNVFKKLRNSKFSDVWLPAREQFNGSGSLGNGGAMRIAPIALYCHSNYPLLLDTASKCTKITHSHRLGVNGALLQAIAVRECFLQNPEEAINIDKFVNNLIKKMAAVEDADRDEIDEGNEVTYENRLKAIQKLLKKEEASDEEVLETLGNGVQAFYSVPTAIYCFLRAQNPIQSIEVTRLQQSYSDFNPFKTDNKFRRTVQYSISLGGDTDTIATMAGALSGAYHGFEYIDKQLQRHCEGLDHILQLADSLHEITPCSE